MNHSFLIGCVADDFTGASDAASFLMAGGLKTILFNGIPPTDQIPDDVGAVVIALKTRTQETRCAVEDSLAAMSWLRKRGCKQLYIKYCSTFDSTPQGNIGPICDAALELCGAAYTLLCPSLPANGRTVRDGHLFVNGQPLHETPMRNHPLTPMWDSFIPRLLRDQSRYPCYLLSRDLLLQGTPAVLSHLEALQAENARFYLVPDYETEADARVIASLFGTQPLLTGGSGLLESLGRIHLGEAQVVADPPPTGQGKAIILAGSCSAATQGQVDYYLQHLGRGIMVQPEALLSGAETAKTIWDRAERLAADANHVLLYSSGSGGSTVERTDEGRAAEALEATMAALARLAADCGYTRIIVAGGETSGAVTKALGLSAYRIGPSIAPGVPIMRPLGNDTMQLVLKSGNFGQQDFFHRALALTEGASL